VRAKTWILVGALATVVAVVAGALYYVALPGTGTLAVEVHDAPCGSCTHVWVTFASVSVHSSNASGGGWMTLKVSGTTLDMMALNGPTMAKEIGLMALPAGHYEQVRLSLVNVTIMFTDGMKVAAMMPAASSGDFNGQFNVTAGHTTTLSIDLDLASSLHVVQNGVGVTCIFTPNIGSVQVM
jgi:hypothetical protein